jgi:pimeloyl-ACP methyl ester carboxylesterase
MHEWPLRGRFSSSAGEVRWARFGTGGDPVVLAHGTPFSSVIWREIAPALAAHHRVHVWDMPGYGQSAAYPGQDVSLAAQAQVLTELLGHWGLTEPLMVAHDSGGAVALGAHLLHGVAYARLALVDAVALPPWGSPFFELAGAHIDVFARLPAELHDGLIRAYIGTASSPGLTAATLDTLAAPWQGDDGRAAFYRQLDQRRSDPAFIDRLIGGYPGIRAPVLVCWGADDRWIPADRGRELAARIPGARLRVIPAAGHLLQEDHPAELATALLAFLHGIE